MGTKIFYSSGNMVELRDGESERFWGRAAKAGFRYYRSLDDIVIPFNHPTITHIILDLKPIEKPVKDPVEQIKASQPKIEDVQKKNADDAKANFEAKAACRHKDSNGVSLRRMKYTETVNGRKYFPVCSFCGHRERYVGVPKIEAGENPLWTMEDIRNAEPYEG